MDLKEILVISLIFSVIAFKQIKEFLLKREQIKADAMVKAEEIMARNKLEMEKLFYKEDQKAASGQSDVKANPSSDDGSLEYKSSEKMKL